MAPTSAYGTAPESSRRLFDALYLDLESKLAGLQPSHAGSVTAIKVLGHGAFAWVYFQRERLQIYLKLPLDSPTIQKPELPQVNVRRSIESAWAKMTPYFVFLAKLEDVGPAARILVECANLSVLSKAPSRAGRLPQEILASDYLEGGVETVLVNRYERDTRARQKCLKHHGTACLACGLAMETVYGNVAKDLIQVHHVRPLAGQGTRTTNPIRDLIPLCPNCHAVVHLHTPPFTLAELKALIEKA